MKIIFHTLILKKNEILQKLRTEKYNDLEDLVYRFQLTYDEIIDILDIKIILRKNRLFATTGYL